VNLTPDAVREVLRSVKYPGYSRDIVSFGLVRDIQVDGTAVGVLIELTSANADAGRQIADEARLALRNAFPGISDAHVQVKVPTPQGAAAQPAGVFQRQKDPRIRRVVAVASGKGGVGKST